MIFRRLLDTYSRSAATMASAEGYVVSFIAHLVLVGGAFIATRKVEFTTTPADSFSAVEYLIPKDRMAGSRPQREQLSWYSLATTGGPGFAASVEKPPEHERLKMAVAKGAETEPETGDAPPAPQAPIALGDSIMTELQVDSAVVRVEDSAAPQYPEALLKRRLEGTVLVQYVVDTLGRADTATFRILAATHMDFAVSVRNTLPRMRFRPALMGTRHVPQLVEQPFVFKIIDTVRVARRTGKRPQGSR